tara:strand:+ start:16928 stop:18019 length:1092 start_codon:yes stop_codon:yes gene_type:complete
MEELIQLIGLDIPQSPRREMGFLDVVDKTTHETTICKVYRYFLDSELSPLLSTVFIDSLKDLILSKFSQKKVTKELDFANYEVFLEVVTNKGRIDIVLHSTNGPSVIIIEVKVYHTLNNDLEDYWEKYDYQIQNKAGVVLALNSFSDEVIANENFVSITHYEWLNKVLEAGLPANLPIRDFIYIHDFYNNMKHITKANEMTEEVRFYLQHAGKINKAILVKDSAYAYLIDQLNTVASNLNLVLYGNSVEYRHLWDQDNHATVYLAVYPEKILLNPSKIEVDLEIYSKAILHKNDLQNMVPAEMRENGGSNNSDVILGRKVYPIELSEFSSLSQTLTNAIETDFSPLIKNMLAFLKNEDADRHM